MTLAAQGRLSPSWLLALGSGFAGAFTAFSAFGLEAHTLFKTGQFRPALCHVGGNLVLGYAALLLGITLGGWLTKTAPSVNP